MEHYVNTMIDTETDPRVRLLYEAADLAAVYVVKRVASLKIGDLSVYQITGFLASRLMTTVSKFTRQDDLHSIMLECHRAQNEEKSWLKLSGARAELHYWIA